MDIALPAVAAWWYLPVVIPLSLWAMWSDLTTMKIPNRITDALVLAFVPLGLMALPWQDFLWQLTHPAVMLALAVVLHAARIYGGGDLKFIVAASPYVMRPDLPLVAVLLALALLVGLGVHRLVLRPLLRRRFPDWASWSATGRYPVALSLGPTLIVYLALAAI